MAIEVLHETRWLSLRECTYRDGRGVEKRWSYVTRPGIRGGVCVIGITAEREIVLARQFRPAVNQEVLSFPAGLLDGEETMAEGALRELREETGWLGTVVAEGPPVFSSPGMTDESIGFVEVRLTERTAWGGDEEEGIAVELVALDKLWDYLGQAHRSGTGVDAKLWAWASARQSMAMEGR